MAAAEMAIRNSVNISICDVDLIPSWVGSRNLNHGNLPVGRAAGRVGRQVRILLFVVQTAPLTGI